VPDLISIWFAGRKLQETRVDVIPSTWLTWKQVWRPLHSTFCISCLICATISASQSKVNHLTYQVVFPTCRSVNLQAGTIAEAMLCRVVVQNITGHLRIYNRGYSEYQVWNIFGCREIRVEKDFYFFIFFCQKMKSIWIFKEKKASLLPLVTYRWVFFDTESTMSCTTKAPKQTTSKTLEELEGNPHWFLQFSPWLIPWPVLGPWQHYRLLMGRWAVMDASTLGALSRSWKLHIHKNISHWIFYFYFYLSIFELKLGWVHRILHSSIFWM
jgi:hypothetical protein